MRTWLLLTALLTPVSVAAQDAALLLGMERYEQLDRVNRADDVLQARDRLEVLGFDVTARANARVGAANDLAASFQTKAGEADRLVVALLGHFVTDGDRTWLLTPEADTVDLFTVQSASVSVDALMQILAERPGQAVLVLGVADPDDLDLDGSFLRAGVGTLDIPQGVTVMQGPPRNAAALMSGILTEPDAVIGQRLRDHPTMAEAGYLPRDWRLMPPEIIVDDTDQIDGPSDADLNAEAELWDETTAADTVAAYRTYIAAFPQGRFVAEAEQQIAAILSEPNRGARLAEEALQLNRTARRDIQADLTLLGYNTRGVDGIFGPGTRGAIVNWQQENGFPQTSYLTRDQISLLNAQAARRQAEIDAEEARQQAAAEQREREFWAETGAQGDEAGYRAYLAQYPDGRFAPIAEARLADIEDQRRAQTEDEDRLAWIDAQADDLSEGALREYLAAFPEGIFADQARERLQAFDTAEDNARAARAEQEEASLRLSGVRAQLLELRLADLGHNPGRIDGVIDGNTRNAIASYQRDQGIPTTGYVDRQTAVGLMTGSINLQFR
ncbi:MAG: peptidoglycan-binding domain-containing protein [Pseudomonadota bacterium]